MQTVSANFDADSKKPNRKISAAAKIDWDSDGTYSDETTDLKLIEVERKVSEPLGGIHSAQFDIKLSNMDDRYSPGSTSPIVSYLAKGKRGYVQMGFNDENINLCSGKCEVPKVVQELRQADLHFFDEANFIQEYKLSDGNRLYLDTRSDLYIWDILDEVYDGKFQVIANCDSTETWSGGSAESTDYRVGDEARKVISTSGAEEKAHTDPGVAADFSTWDDDDYFTCFVYIDDVTKVDELIIRLHSVVDDAWYDLDLTLLDIETGWNEIWVNKGQFISADTTYPPASWFIIGTSEIEGAEVIPPRETDWSSIVRIELIVKATGSDTLTTIFDELRFVDQFDYPRRYFDVGLQTIPVASWDGNTALYEIKVACESEGARFYADENGGLHFENRQHYNNYPEYKVSSAGFDFSTILAYQHSESEQGIINSVTMRLTPRKLVATEEIWRYPFVVQIAAGATKEIWGSFADPVPVTATGIVDPVSTTDYTANDAEDVTGTDRTSSISIVITKFVTAAKLEVTNSHSGAVYLTMLKLRGTPAKKSDEVKIKQTDATSIATYGELPPGGLQVESKYLSSESYADDLALQIIDWYKNPLERIKIKCMALPQLQIGDMITVRNSIIGVDFLMRIMGIKISLSEAEGMIQEISARSVAPFETLTFFEIGTSSIESVDVISK